MSMRTTPVWDHWPTELDWQPMARQLTTVWLLKSLLGVLLLGVLAVIPVLLWLGLEGLYWLLGGLAAFALLRAWTIVRAIHAWGYAERDEDLLVRHGLLVRHLSIVPYGRIQLIDLSAGPLERMFGLTTVQVRTAALFSTTDIPGLDPAAAQALRDRLAQRAAAAREGL